jgi:class 3 adenylate cyclase
VLVMVDWAGGAGFDPQPGREARAMATILFSDIVGATALARDAGDTSWERTVAMHEDVVRSVLAGFGGRERETAGDSFLISSAALRAPSAADSHWSEPSPRYRSRSGSASTAARW